VSAANPQGAATVTTTADPTHAQEHPGPASAPAAPPKVRQPLHIKALAVWGVVALLLAGAAYVGIPMVTLALNTVSTDDAYVNGHVTFVAARVPGQVVKVLVDDNNRVKKGDLLVTLDTEPYRVQVAIKQAALDTAKAEYVVAQATVNSQVAMARASRFKMDHAMEQVQNQVAELHASVAALDSELAIRERALKDLDRFKEVARTPGAVTPRDLDLHQQEFEVARAKVRQSLDNIYQLRAGLGLPNPVVDADKLTKAPADLSATPPDLEQTFSTVRQAAAAVMEAIAPLGITISSFDLKPKAIMEEFLRRDPTGNIDRIYAEVIKTAPPLQQAKAKIESAQADLDQANLNLSYCNVRAEIDGVVTRRNVNPGNNVQAGQSLMAIRSLTEIWIDANFKETQLADLRIGQPVKIETDLYGSHEEFEGRITGFTMGTGQTLALLPPQNATGNFVKIVQRLPVRIELNNYDPDKKPLFIGTSVEPYVYIHEPLVGDDPGKGSALQPSILPASAK
jgi:membrane fusion protein (multidrug efflux system)